MTADVTEPTISTSWPFSAVSTMASTLVVSTVLATMSTSPPCSETAPFVVRLALKVLRKELNLPSLLGADPELLTVLGADPSLLAFLGVEPELLAVLGADPELLATLGVDPELLAVLGVEPELLVDKLLLDLCEVLDSFSVEVRLVPLGVRLCLLPLALRWLPFSFLPALCFLRPDEDRLNDFRAILSPEALW